MARGPAVCGTRSGYNRHRRNGEETCRACKDAVRDAANRARTAKRNRPVIGTGLRNDTLCVEIRCPMCGDPTVERNSRKTRAELVAVVQCVATKTCGHLFIVRMAITAAYPDEDFESTRCGTAAGAQRHYRAGETPCDACQMAHTVANRDRNKKSREKKRAAA